VLLPDGTGATVRRLTAADLAAVERLHADLPRDDLYRRFFGFSDTAPHMVAPLIVGTDSVAVGLFQNDVLRGVANFRGAEPPELAMAVAHDAQHHGIGTLLLEALVNQARAQGVSRLVCEVLATNLPMLRVLAESRLRCSRRSDGPTVHITIDITAESASDFARVELERHDEAEAVSLRPLLGPRSVARSTSPRPEPAPKLQPGRAGAGCPLEDRVTWDLCHARGRRLAPSADVHGGARLV
jgi:GNAT superfamily N-acetyltransferase